MSDELIVLTLRPLADPDGVDRRLRWALKRLLRWDKLQCVSVASGAEAWAGWRVDPERGWVRACAARTPQLHGHPWGSFMVLPNGVQP